MEECLKYVLSLGVPPAKLSLGIAAYSDWWYPAWDAKAGARMRGSDISFARGMEILRSAGVAPVWDDVQKAPGAAWDERAASTGCLAGHRWERTGGCRGELRHRFRGGEGIPRRQHRFDLELG